MAAERLWILLGKKKSGEINADESAELDRLLAANHASGYTTEIIDKIWDAPLKDTGHAGDAWDSIKANISATTEPSSSRFFLFSAKWKVAAGILAVTLVSALTILSLRTKEKDPSPTAALLNQVATQPGSKTKLELPDGTQVWLNANSHLSYGNDNFGSANRIVSLTGEAFFDVVKNEKVPFIIHTGSITITVKGTAFNVKAYPGDKTIETSLVRGLIEINTKQDPERKIILKPDEKIIIPVEKTDTVKTPAGEAEKTESPGSLYTITKLKKNSPAEISETVWMKNKLQFDNESFEQIAPKMEAWFNIRVYFRDEKLKSKRFTATIEKETLFQTLDALQLSYHFLYEVEDNILWIGKK